MRKLFLAALLCISALSHSQITLFEGSFKGQVLEIGKSIQDQVDSIVKVRLNEFSKLLDSTYNKQITSGGTIILDTLTAPINGVAIYQLSLAGVQGLNRPSAVKIVTISNDNGAVSVVSNVNPLAFRGLTGASWDVVIINKRAVVRIVAPVQPTSWTYKKTNL